jgi:hypothetical protein
MRLRRLELKNLNARSENSFLLFEESLHTITKVFMHRHKWKQSLAKNKKKDTRIGIEPAQPKKCMLRARIFCI